MPRYPVLPEKCGHTGGTIAAMSIDHREDPENPWQELLVRCMNCGSDFVLKKDFEEVHAQLMDANEKLELALQGLKDIREELDKHRS